MLFLYIHRTEPKKRPYVLLFFFRHKNRIDCILHTLLVPPNQAQKPHGSETMVRAKISEKWNSTIAQFQLFYSCGIDYNSFLDAQTK